MSKSKYVTGEEGFCNGIHSDQKAVVQSLNSEISDMAIVGYDAMQRANSTLEDFVRRNLTSEYTKQFRL